MKTNNNEIIGRRYGRLTVLSLSCLDKSGKKKWLCRCDCGVEKVIYEQSFCRGKTKSCGCYNQESASKRMSQGWNQILTRDYLMDNHVNKKLTLREIAKNVGCSLGCVTRYVEKHNVPVNDSFYDIVGKRFGRLVVQSISHTKNESSYWNVLCDCGSTKIVIGRSLVRSQVISCGCWNQEKDWRGIGDLSKSYWSRIIKGAIKRNIECNISIEYAWELYKKQDRKCALSGVSILMDRKYGYNSGKKNVIQTASLDRKDSRYGYIDGNVQWVHTTVNRMKSNLSQDVFVDFCLKISMMKYS